jgi:hypothetical protein
VAQRTLQRVCYEDTTRFSSGCHVCFSLSFVPCLTRYSVSRYLLDGSGADVDDALRASSASKNEPHVLSILIPIVLLSKRVGPSNYMFAVRAQVEQLEEVWVFCLSLSSSSFRRACCCLLATSLLRFSQSTSTDSLRNRVGQRFLRASQSTSSVGLQVRTNIFICVWRN